MGGRSHTSSTTHKHRRHRDGAQSKVSADTYSDEPGYDQTGVPEGGYVDDYYTDVDTRDANDTTLYHDTHPGFGSTGYGSGVQQDINGVHRGSNIAGTTYSGCRHSSRVCAKCLRQYQESAVDTGECRCGHNCPENGGCRKPTTYSRDEGTVQNTTRSEDRVQYEDDDYDYNQDYQGVAYGQGPYEDPNQDSYRDPYPESGIPEGKGKSSKKPHKEEGKGKTREAHREPADSRSKSRSHAQPPREGHGKSRNSKESKPSSSKEVKPSSSGAQSSKDKRERPETSSSSRTKTSVESSSKSSRREGGQGGTRDSDSAYPYSPSTYEDRPYEHSRLAETFGTMQMKDDGYDGYDGYGGYNRR